MPLKGSESFLRKVDFISRRRLITKSLSRPRVVKAYRLLERARKKLVEVLALGDATREHLTLVPAAWTQSALAAFGVCN